MRKVESEITQNRIEWVEVDNDERDIKDFYFVIKSPLMVNNARNSFKHFC